MTAGLKIQSSSIRYGVKIGKFFTAFVYMNSIQKISHGLYYDNAALKKCLNHHHICELSITSNMWVFHNFKIITGLLTRNIKYI